MIRLFNIPAVLFVALLWFGCDSGLDTSSEVQRAREVQWLPSGNSLVGFVQYFVTNAYSTDPGLIFKVTPIDANGKTGGSYNTKEPAYDNFYYGIFLTLFPTIDNAHVFAQLGRNVYKVTLSNGNVQEIVKDFRLSIVSPDGRFVVGTHSQNLLIRKTLTVYDVSSSPIRKVLGKEIDSLSILAGVWLGNGQFALTVNDSVGWHIDIYDTTGALKHRVGGAATPTHNVDFIASTNHLYFRANDGSVGMIDLNNFVESQPIHFEVQNFDVSNDERLIYYTIRSGDKVYLKRYDTQTGDNSQLADDVFWGAFLSPDENKIAYVYERKVNFEEVKVLSLP